MGEEPTQEVERKRRVRIERVESNNKRVRENREYSTIIVERVKLLTNANIRCCDNRIVQVHCTVFYNDTNNDIIIIIIIIIMPSIPTTRIKQSQKQTTTATTGGGVEKNTKGRVVVEDDKQRLEQIIKDNDRKYPQFHLYHVWNQFIQDDQVFSAMDAFQRGSMERDCVPCLIHCIFCLLALHTTDSHGTSLN